LLIEVIFIAAYFSSVIVHVQFVCVIFEVNVKVEFNIRDKQLVSMLSVCLSVRLSVCPVPPPRGKTKRPANTKLGRKGPRDTSTPWTNFKVKGSKLKVTGYSSCVNVSLIIRISRW